MTTANDPAWAFSLGRGAPGIMLAHAHRAHADRAPWDQAHAWAQSMVDSPVPAGQSASLFEGAPAVAFALHAADHPAYAPALETVDQASLHLIEQRLEAAHARLTAGQLPALSEFDLINGLSGLAVYLMNLHPKQPLVRDVLAYLVELTHPVQQPVGTLPGWWTHHSPADHPDPHFAQGHGNLGIAHGIHGPLAVLSTAHLSGTTVPGQAEAITRILAWADTHRRAATSGAWWPEWVTDKPATHHEHGPGRPSWCYGTPGIAWSQHLAGRALSDLDRQRGAEQALLDCLEDTRQMSRLVQPGLCHGQAGLFLVLERMREHALLPGLRSATAPAVPSACAGPGLLEGQAGLDLLRTETDATWANCLLLGRSPVPQRTRTPDS